jgi:hypothetical protein
MKTQKFILLVIISILLTSCSTTIFYYQVYKTAYSDKIKLDENNLFYEDDNCKVVYNLWSDGGDIGFRFYNKTDKNIYLKMDECFFIFNGIAYNYYKNRVVTNSSNSGTSVSYGANLSNSVTGYNYFNLIQTNQFSLSKSSGIISSKGYSVSTNEEKVICIPSKTSKIISEFSINQSLIRNCDLYKYPTKNQVKSIEFDKSKSPFVFSNRITYGLGQDTTPIKFENEFYVSEITNYSQKDILIFKTVEYCGQKGMTYTKYFKNSTPDKFYIKYSKGRDYWKH